MQTLRHAGILLTCLLLCATNTQAESTPTPVFSSAQTSLNGCPPTNRNSFKREKTISEQCEAKDDFTIFIEGDTEDTLKFVLEQNFSKRIADDPYARRIRISQPGGGDDFLSGEISGQQVEWVYRNDVLTGLVLRRLADDVKTFEAFRLLENGYFCHIGGDPESEQAVKLLETGKSCHS